MPQHVIIDGNNLLHAMHAHAPLPAIGRETLVKVIERWAGAREDLVTLVFDGPVPRGGLARQMSSGRIAVRFAAPATADDVIVEMIHHASQPTALVVVTGDTAIRHEARLGACRTFGRPSSCDLPRTFSERALLCYQHGYTLCEHRSGHTHAATSGPA